MDKIVRWRLTTNAESAEVVTNEIEMLSFLVQEEDASGVMTRRAAWMSITFASVPNCTRSRRIAVCSPRYVCHVISGFTLTLPPLVTKDSY